MHKQDMKRGFLFGLGAFFILLPIIEPETSGSSSERIQSVILMLISMPVGAFVFDKAIVAPPNLSKSRGVLGWFIGFFAPYEVVVALNMAAGVNFPACLLRLF